MVYLSVSKKSQKPLKWVGSSLKDLRKFPEEVKDDMGHALLIVQRGEKPRLAKPLKGYKGAGILEIVENYDKDTYRAVYTVNFNKAIYVLHCFQKKSKKGIKTPAKDIKLITQRLKDAEENYLKDFGEDG